MNPTGNLVYADQEAAEPSPARRAGLGDRETLST